MTQVAWHINRLRSMNGREVSHRLMEQARRFRAQGQAYLWSDFSGPAASLPSLPIPPINNLPEASVDNWRKVYASVKAGKFEFLGVRWPQDGKGSSPSDLWHLDPVTGKIWPSDIYCFRVPYRENKDRGDVKYVWELNRLQFLQPLVALSAATGEQGPARLCLRLLDEWMQANPPFKGVNWVSGIELALRTISILTVLALIDPKLISRARRARLSACLKAHGYWLMRYPSKFSSANNHLIAEACALFALGTCWPRLDEAEDYAKYGARVLAREAQNQFHGDGVGAEQSPSYTAFTLEWYLLSLWLGKKAGVPFDAGVSEAVTSAAHHLRWMMDDAGHVPAIGDDDGCSVFARSEAEGGHYISGVLANLSAFMEDPSIAPPVCQPHLRDLLCGAAQPLQAFPEGARTFDRGGYTVFRKTINGRNVMLVLDHGPLGHLAIAAHGHADALSVWLHIDGQPVFVDAGTYLYHSVGPWRDHFRSTRAHNTVTIGETSSSVMTGAFNWGRRANCEIISPLEGCGKVWRIKVAHDGYGPDFKVSHQREIRFDLAGKIEIIDQLVARSPRSKEDLPPAHAGLMLDPALTANQGAHGIDVSGPDGKLITVLARDAASALRLESADAPHPPFYSSRFGKKEPATRLVLDLEPALSPQNTLTKSDPDEEDVQARAHMTLDVSGS